MSRTATVSISFSFNMDEDPIFEFVDTDWTDDKKIEYFKECFLDDIYTLQNQSELFDYLEVELG